MKLSQLLHDTGIKCEDTTENRGGDPEISGVCCDSRRVKPGDLFVCLKGKNADGEEFAEEARQRGAAAILRRLEGGAMPDWTTAAMLAARIWDHPDRKLTMIGVTGTNGKTTTTWMIRRILNRLGVGCGLIGTVVYETGDEALAADRTTPQPDQLYRLLHEMRRSGCTACAMEVSSHGLALGRVETLEFQYGVFTNLTEDHLDFHGTMEAYYRAKKGEYTLFTLKERLTGGTLPKVYTVDLREELKSGNRSVFSEKLKELMADRLNKGEQIMLFLNRRGYAGFISCRSCGHVMKCPHCDVSLSEHKGNKLICHYCGYTTGSVKLCPECGSPYIMAFRAGTQQIEEKVKEMFPQARVLRMDADTTGKKDSYDRILSSFSDGEADVLIGTQMIVKGHDFPNVTLIGVLAADLSLAAGDYRASERTFCLLTQAAGRAGRGQIPGEAVIQTYQPEHYSIVHAANQDYEGFYEEEILYREMLRYPPACHMMAVQIFADREENGEKLADLLTKTAKKYVDVSESLDRRLLVIGPAPAGIGKLHDIFRFVFYVKYEKYDKLVEIKDALEEQVQNMQLKNESMQIDFDPVNAF